MPPGFGGGRARKPRKGADEEQNYHVTLEELYKGKTVKFASTKNVVCSHCKGTGGKEKAKSKQCASCQGKGALLMWTLIITIDANVPRLQAGSTECRARLGHSGNGHL